MNKLREAENKEVNIDHAIQIKLMEICNFGGFLQSLKIIYAPGFFNDFTSTIFF
jgi:hypothetical protein